MLLVLFNIQKISALRIRAVENSLKFRQFLLHVLNQSVCLTWTTWYSFLFTDSIAWLGHNIKLGFIWISQHCLATGASLSICSFQQFPSTGMQGQWKSLWPCSKNKIFSHSILIRNWTNKIWLLIWTCASLDLVLVPSIVWELEDMYAANRWGLLQAD